MLSQLPAILRRRMNFKFRLEDNRHWMHEAGYAEEILNVISYFFPIGEKYFIDSVKYYQDQISDPVLQEQVKDFIYQEATHTKQHIRANEVLDNSQAYGAKIEMISEFMLFKTRWFTPKVTQLAVTCAIEHFTALLSDYLLERVDYFYSITNESFGSLWAWHAVEETEHKAVCFDVYQHIYGNGVFSYIHRVFVMMLVSFCFLIAIIVGLFIIRKGQRRTQKTRDAGLAPASKGQNGFSSKKTYRKLWKFMKSAVNFRLYFNYYRPSFHPWDHDNSHLVYRWREANPDIAVSSKKAD